MSIEQELFNWNSKSTNDIEKIYEKYYEEPTFLSKIISLSKRKEIQKGATWLLKRYVESGHKVKIMDTKNIYSILPELEDWEAKLHILQSIDYMPIGESEKFIVERFLRDYIVSEKKLVRAWAYNGFYRLSIQHKEYKEEAKIMFEIAMKDEVASVKARIRNIMKKGF